MKKWWQVLSWFIGAFSLFIFLLYFFEWKTTKNLIATTEVSAVCLSVVFLFFAIFLRAFKWTYILRLKEDLTWRNGYHTIVISILVNFIFPVRFGEFLKLYIIKKISGVSYPSSISATLSDRFSHLLIVLMFLLFTPMAGFELSQWSARFIGFLVIFVIFLFSFFFWGIRFFEIFERGIKRLLSLFRGDQYNVDDFSKSKLICFFRETLERMNISEFSKWNLFVIVLLSVIIISVDGICYYFIIKAFGVPITWLQGTLAACFMQLMFILPTPPGQVGTAEMYPVLIFSWGLGLPSSIISSAAILWHLLTTAVFVVLGLCSAVSLGVDLRTILDKIREQKLQEKSVAARD